MFSILNIREKNRRKELVRDLFSIVIPAYNQAAWLGGAIDSALAQTFSAREVIVVNDGSTDETPAVMKQYGHRIRAFHQPNQGLSATRNRGFAEASGKYIVFLDSDDVLFPWSLEVLREEIEKADSPALVLSMARPFGRRSELGCEKRGEMVVARWSDYLAGAAGRLRITVAGAIRRDVLVNAGGFWSVANGAEDHDFWLRAGTERGFSYIHSPPIYGYRQHEESITRSSERIANGVGVILRHEANKTYPGGRARAGQRRQIIGRLACWAIKRCLELGGRREAGALYRQSLPLLLRAGMVGSALKIPFRLFRREREVFAPGKKIAAEV